MKLRSIGPNQTEVESDDGTTVLYSYSTAVAVFVPGKGGLCTTTKHSKTTSRHVNAALSRWGCSRTDVPQADIDKLAERK